MEPDPPKELPPPPQPLAELDSTICGSVTRCIHVAPHALAARLARWTRALLLQEPPSAQTLFAPLSPRPWTAGEVLAAGVIVGGTMLIACAALWRDYTAQKRKGQNVQPQA